jgi:hypothetical protein
MAEIEPQKINEDEIKIYEINDLNNNLKIHYINGYINITFFKDFVDDKYVFTFNKFENNYESKKSLYLFINYLLDESNKFDLKPENPVLTLIQKENIYKAYTSIGFKKMMTTKKIMMTSIVMTTMSLFQLLQY